MRFLHISNPDTEIAPGDPGYDKLGTVRVLINILKFTFPAEYHMPKDVAVDEAMIPFKGRVSFRQLFPE